MRIKFEPSVFLLKSVRVADLMSNSSRSFHSRLDGFLAWFLLGRCKICSAVAGRLNCKHGLSDLYLTSTTYSLGQATQSSLFSNAEFYLKGLLSGL